MILSKNIVGTWDICLKNQLVFSSQLPPGLSHQCQEAIPADGGFPPFRLLLFSVIPVPILHRLKNIKHKIGPTHEHERQEDF